MGSEHHTKIVKGKRTKRQRSSSSPFGFPATDTSSSGSGDAYYHYESTEEEEEEEEEEEDMANCLIMLAQGDPFQKSSVTSDDNNKVGLYIYECKTCNRSFTSFQALGGHRASHKKPKATLELPEKKSPSSTGFDSVSAGSSPPLVVHHNHNNKGGHKIHECSICGSEFTSGQALGGHMRRHRAAAAAAATANKQVKNESNIIAGAVAVKTRSVLPLDLNLPAPEDDRYIGSLVFSAPALVDCHY